MPIFFKSLKANKISKSVITNSNLTNYFEGLVTTGFGPDVTRGLPL